ncbi:hypothetical protein [Shewanella violacea]|uniref:Uncharacterized protein n=1 Tax=Shewanella violacea (strain JCM 10179 / CIP 106290 / LMG 19151 / DSS12) TaxID=637905 RepID=D4ZF63_SHEVD|nr:hypothetical protein [Shewanella violacea]BAJ04227.1 hypothetical protein SVI_4256 [Shewanella violacea DSS12]
MESIINFEEILDLVGTPENKLRRYRACLREFDRLQYDDPFIKQIRNEIVHLEAQVKACGS